MNRMRVTSLCLTFSLLGSQSPTWAQQADTFKVKYVGGYPSVTKKYEGQIQFNNETGALVFFKGGKQQLFVIPYEHITAVSADERARRRVKETVILGATLIGVFALPILFSKKKMRFVMVEFRDPQQDTAGAALFRVKKRHKVGLMVATAERADLPRQGPDLFAHEDTSAPQESTDPATSSQPEQSLSEVSIRSEPEAADVELDGKFIGNTPLTLRLAPGQYEITVKKAGFLEWKRTVEVLLDNQTKILAELTKLGTP